MERREKGSLWAKWNEEEEKIDGIVVLRVDLSLVVE